MPDQNQTPEELARLHESTDSGERWTIHVCPHCRALCPSDDWDDAPCACPDDGDILAVSVVASSSSDGGEREALAEDGPDA